MNVFAKTNMIQLVHPLFLANVGRCPAFVGNWKAPRSNSTPVMSGLEHRQAAPVLSTFPARTLVRQDIVDGHQAWPGHITDAIAYYERHKGSCEAQPKHVIRLQGIGYVGLGSLSTRILHPELT